MYMLSFHFVYICTFVYNGLIVSTPQLPQKSKKKKSFPSETILPF